MKKDTEYSETNKRVPLQVDLSQRNVSTTTDQLGSNNFIEKTKKDQRFTTKRPGIMLEIAGSGSGQGIFAYNDIIYSWDNTLSPTAPVVTPLSRGTFRYFVVRDYLDTTDSEYRFIEVSPDALYIATGRYIGTGPYPYSKGDYLTASSSYIGPQITRTAYNTVRYKALTHMAAAAITGSGTIPTASLTTASLWTLLSSSVTPFANFGILGVWFLNGYVYVYAYSDAGQTTYDLYRSNGDITNSATYSLVASGAIPSGYASGYIPWTELYGSIFQSGSTGYAMDDGGAGGFVYTTVDGFTWTSPTFDTGFIWGTFLVNVAFFGSFLYGWQRGGGGLFKFTDSTSATAVATSGLTINSLSYCAVATLGADLYIVECNAGSNYIKTWKSSDGVNWTLVSTLTHASVGFPEILWVSGSKLYVLVFSGSLHSYLDYSTTNGTDAEIQLISLTGTFSSAPYAIGIVNSNMYSCTVGNSGTSLLIHQRDPL